MMQRVLWKLNSFCSSFHNVEVPRVGAGMMKSKTSGSLCSCITKKLCTLICQLCNCNLCNELEVSSLMSNCRVQLKYLNIWLPERIPWWTSMCKLSSQPRGYVLIKQTKSELITTHAFFYKRSSGLKWNGIELKEQGMFDLSTFI